MGADRDANTMRWVRLGSLGFVLVVGWGFIAWQNNFHVTPPLVFVALGYLAVVLTTYNLWRTGAAAVAHNDEDDGDASWGKPTGALGELDREKRTMLKAIKEAEFDQAMGKLSRADAEQMIQMYRARAIEVMKEIEQLELGAAGTVRERILREVKARVALEGKLKDKSRVTDDNDTRRAEEKHADDKREEDENQPPPPQAAEAKPAEDAVKPTETAPVPDDNSDARAQEASS